MVFLKEFFEKVEFEKNQQTTKKHAKLPRGQRVNATDEAYLCMPENVFLFFSFLNSSASLRKSSNSFSPDTALCLNNGTIYKKINIENSVITVNLKVKHVVKW